MKISTETRSSTTTLSAFRKSPSASPANRPVASGHRASTIALSGSATPPRRSLSLWSTDHDRRCEVQTGRGDWSWTRRHVRGHYAGEQRLSGHHPGEEPATRGQAQSTEDQGVQLRSGTIDIHAA